jgi:hypothetical protein
MHICACSVHVSNSHTPFALATGVQRGMTGPSGLIGLICVCHVTVPVAFTITDLCPIGSVSTSAAQHGVALGHANCHASRSWVTPVAVGVTVGVGVLLGVLVGVPVLVGVFVFVGVGVGVGVRVCTGVELGLNVCVGVFVGVPVRVRDGVLLGVGVRVGVLVGVGVFVGVFVMVGVSVGVSVGVRVGVFVIVGVCVGVFGMGVSVGVSVCASTGPMPLNSRIATTSPIKRICVIEPP